MRETDEEIREIKREIIESRGLIIKSNNLVNSLGADIKSIAKRQAGYERRFNWNGAVAFVLFATISFVGLKLGSDAQIARIAAESAELEARNQELRRELAEETSRAEERANAESRAAQFYALIQQQKRREVVTRYAAIRDEALSRAEAQFFREVYDRFRLDLSIEAFQNGLDMMRTGRYAEAADKFNEAIRLKDDAAHIPNVKYQLARALRRLGRQSEAMIHARQVVEQRVVPELQDDAMFLIALCAEELDDFDTAIESYSTLIRRWPRSAVSREARPMLREVRIRSRRRD